MAQSSPAASRKNILILGGSYGGVSTAHYLLKHAIPVLPDKENYQVVLVSPSPFVMCRPACPRALISDDLLPQDKLFVDIATQFQQYPTDSFRFVNGAAIKVDHDARVVKIDLAGAGSEDFSFHALIIATGASTPSPLLGLNRDDKYLRQSWEAFRQALPEAKNIVIGGGGPAGVETAGELGEYINGRAGWFSAKPETKVRITVVTSASKILPNLRPAIAQKAEAYLEKVGVDVIKDARVKSVSPDGAGTENVASKASITLENGKTLEADLYIPAFGTTPNTAFMDGSLLAPDRRIEVNPSTLRVDKAGSRIYAVGDVAAAARPAVHIIFEQIPVLCTNIKHDLLIAAGKPESEVGESRTFKEDKRETQMVPIGQSVGVGAAMGWQLPSFMVWLIKGRDYWLWTTGALWSGKQWAKES